MSSYYLAEGFYIMYQCGCDCRYHVKSIIMTFVLLVSCPRLLLLILIINFMGHHIVMIIIIIILTTSIPSSSSG